MKILLKSRKKNYICTIAIGKKHKFNWEEYSKQNWLKYCKKHDIGLIVFYDDLIKKNDIYWKKATWQKLLIGDYLINNKIYVNNICFLDIDIIINHLSSPNIFDHHNDKFITVVSQRKNLGVDLNQTLKQIAYNRNHYFSKNYPLHSALFMTPIEIFDFHKFKLNKRLIKENNYFCAGLFIFNQKKYSEILKKIFFKYKNSFNSITQGDEPILNYEFQKNNIVKYIDYRFQSIWLYEIASKYPFLYDKNIRTRKLIIRCIENSLSNNYFLHFAGSWGESDMWRIKNLDKIIFKSPRVINYNKYLDTKIISKPKGRILP